jgi:predicted esterase
MEKEAGNGKLLIYLTDGEKELERLTAVDANVVKCHIISEGRDITQEELYNEKNVNQLMIQFADVIKSYKEQTNAESSIILGSDRHAEVALDLLLKENELIEGGILIKPILNIAITDGIRIEDGTKVLIIGGDQEADIKQIEERDIADILGVNGYEVTLIELDEGESLTNEDISQSMDWIQKKF